MGGTFGRERSGTCVAAALLLLLSSGAHAADEEKAAALTPAQTALFATDHLGAIRKPETLDYSFHHEGGAADYSDKVALTLGPLRPDGARDVTVAFLSGEHRVPFPPLTDFKGNPLLMYFLEYDVTEMNHMTGGAPGYFRNRIRAAFREGAEMETVSFSLAGKECQGTEITIHPYARLTLPAMAHFAAKTYRFLLSDAVPGMIYRITSEVPEAADAPAIRDSVTWTDEQP